MIFQHFSQVCSTILMRLALQMIMADPTQPSETVLFDRSAPSSPSSAPSPLVNQQASSSDPFIDNHQPAPVSPQALSSQPVSMPSHPLQNQSLPMTGQASSMNPSVESINEFNSEVPAIMPESEPSATSHTSSVTSEPASDADLDTTAASNSEADSVTNDLVGFDQNSGKVIVLHQPVSLLIVKLVGISLFYFLVLWLLHRVLVALLGVFPKLVPDYPVNDFIGSPLLFWGSILFILIVIGIILRWWTIFFQISSSEVVAHSGIIIKQAKVLKRIGISVRQIEIKRNLLGMLLNYVTIEIGSEVMGGVSMTISDRPESLQMMTDALKPGEVLQTKKLF